MAPTWSPSVWFALVYMDDALRARAWCDEPVAQEHIACENFQVK